MTYTRIRNQEFSIKIKPLNSSPNILYTDPDKFYNDVESFLKQKYPNQFSIKSQEKVGIEYFTKKLIEGLKKDKKPNYGSIKDRKSEPENGATVLLSIKGKVNASR